MPQQACPEQVEGSGMMSAKEKARRFPAGPFPQSDP
jgi:hypothetical protein